MDGKDVRHWVLGESYCSFSRIVSKELDDNL